MSTFRGVLQEFPDIRIDFFRPAPGLRPPRKCFLSHVHSDHLVGLETPYFHTCFIYCSAATREILLQLEKYPQRLNFQQGILEKRPKVTYKHLNKLLKTIPLETPTRIELEPGNDIQVTLFDANHCTGAVMFLIEGDNKAILYTGDIRSEPWFVNNLTRNHFLIEYTCGLKTLDCIYLDTSNTAEIPFPTKSDGLKELLQKVSKYPADTVFHFTAWTFGYEEVWMALSRALKSQIHVDEYKMRLYESLRGRTHDPKDPTSEKYLSGPFLAHEGPALAGYTCGNIFQPGCLTSDPNANVRIHSCEKGLYCDEINDETVWIRPIIARTNHGEMAEVGVDGGLDPEEGDISLTTTEATAPSVAGKKSALLSESPADALPQVITFPYSRHSSYAELCHLVRVFSPKDVYPCTVDEANWDEEVSMENLFGQECSTNEFRHDNEMRELHAVRQLHRETRHSQTTATSDSSSQRQPPSSPVRRNAMLPPSSPVHAKSQTSRVYSLGRNSQGQLRFYDADGSEKLPSGEELQQELAETDKVSELASNDRFGRGLGEVTSGIHSTPPKDMIAVSPGSASQNLRRKAIHEGLEGQAKRFRLSYDGPASPPSAEARVTTPQKGIKLSAVVEISNESNDSDAPTLSCNVDRVFESVEHRPVPNASSTIQTTSGEAAHTGGDPYRREFAGIFYDEGDDTYVEHDDEDRSIVTRCKDCGHEMWTVWMTSIGFCTHCEPDAHREHPDHLPYYEIIDADAGPRPEIEFGCFADGYLLTLDHEARRKNIVGDYIDEHSDAYDTFDEDASHASAYDSADSFIDDASIRSPPEEAQDEHASNDDGGAHYEYREMLRQLQRKHRRLRARFEGVMRELVDSDYEHDSSSSEEAFDPAADDARGEVDELLVEVVEVVPADAAVAVAELVLSQAQAQSPACEVSADRVAVRVRAFEAAAGERWGDISLVSAGDNHAEVEVEL